MILNIALVETQLMFSEALAGLLMNTKEIEVGKIEIFTDPEKFINNLIDSDTNLLITGLSLPKMDGIEVISNVKEIDKSIRIIVLTQYDSYKFIKDSFQRGCDAFMLKTNSFPQLLSCIREVVIGNTYMGPGVRLLPSKPNTNLAGKFSDSFLIKHNLTSREHEILSLISQAKTNKEIGKQLYISDQTVSVHRKNIMRKLKVNNAASLVKKAIELKLIN